MKYVYFILYLISLLMKKKHYALLIDRESNFIKKIEIKGDVL